MSGKKFTAVVSLIPVLTLAFGASAQALGQSQRSYASMAPTDQYLMTDRNAEIALARSAAPASISRDATVLILGRHGYETAAKGKDGFVCVVDRGWMLPFDKPDFWNPKVRLPTCMNAPAAQFHIPLTYKTTELALARVTRDQISARLKAAYDNHELPLPANGSMCYMMSKRQYFGDKEGNAGDSHLMFWFPQGEHVNWGADALDSPVDVHQYSPQPITEFTISTSKWSDGTPVGQASESSPKATLALRASAFNGTWRANNGSMEYHGSNKYSLQKGIWRCDTCLPKIAIKADGRDHRVNSSLYFGAPYAETESVREVNDHNIEITDKRSGKVVATNELTTSADGKMLTTVWKEISDSGKESGGKFESERTGGASAGANKVSGEWRPVRTSTSEDIVTVSYNATADGLAMSDPTGESFSAKFDGKEYPFKGDPGVTSVVVNKIDENTIEETDIYKGRETAVSRMTVDRDGKVMRVTVEDKLHTAKISWTANKL